MNGPRSPLGCQESIGGGGRGIVLEPERRGTRQDAPGATQRERGGCSLVLRNARDSWGLVAIHCCQEMPRVLQRAPVVTIVWNCVIPCTYILTTQWRGSGQPRRRRGGRGRWPMCGCPPISRLTGACPSKRSRPR